MPPGRGKKLAKAPQAPEERHVICPDFEDVQPDSEPEDSQVSDSSRRKRTREQGPGVGLEVQSLLSTFGADISKSFETKRKRLETFAQSSAKASGKRVDDMWKRQQQERMSLGNEYQKQVHTVLSQMESDLAKSKKEQDNLSEIMKKTEKTFQQQRIVQTQRTKTIRKLHDQYMKGMSDLDEAHREQQTAIQSELKKEMTLLQKKILMETQQQELSNVRRSLQSMLAQV